LHIDIIGGGSIGLLLGARLAAAGTSVMIWTRTEEQARQLAAGGVRLVPQRGAEQIIPIASRWIGDGAVPDGPSVAADTCRLALLTVKQTALNDGLLVALSRIFGHSLVNRKAAMVCFQNGIGHMERIAERLPGLPLWSAVTTEGARRLDGWGVQHTGAGEIWFGPWPEGDATDLPAEPLEKMFADRLESAGFSSHLSKKMEIHIFYKLMINAIINPLTALYDVSNGQLPEHKLRLQMMKALHAETEQVLRASGKPVNPHGWQRILEVCRNTRDNVSSMLGDVRSGRETEIDSINGQLALLAAAQGMRAPLNEAVTELVRALYLKPDLKE
jgi:2-dehydropantoate 2-reductase